MSRKCHRFRLVLYVAPIVTVTAPRLHQISRQASEAYEACTVEYSKHREPSKLPSRDPFGLLQDDGSVSLKHQACSVNHMCTFTITQTMQNAGGAQAGGRPDGAHRSAEVETTYTVNVQNLGGGAGAVLIKMDVLAVCGLKQRSASQTDRKTALLDSSSTGALEEALKEHSVFFLHNEDGSCTSYCFHEKDNVGVRHAKKTLMREFCTSVSSVDALAQTAAPTSAQPGQMYQITHQYGVEAPYKRKYRWEKANDDTGNWKVHFEDDHLDEELLQVNTPLGVNNMLAFRSVHMPGRCVHAPHCHVQSFPHPLQLCAQERDCKR